MGMRKRVIKQGSYAQNSVQNIYKLINQSTQRYWFATQLFLPGIQTTYQM